MTPHDAYGMIVGAAASVLAFFVFGGVSSPSMSPFHAVPRDSFIVATVDVDELRRSPIYEALVASSGGREAEQALGVRALAAACGFDPVSRVRTLAISVPEAATERGEFGLAAKIDVTRSELETCADAFAKQRGARAEAHRIGNFVVLEAGGEASLRPRLAYGGGLLVVGKGTWLEAMLGAAERTKPSIAQSAEHMALRSAVERREGFRAPTVLVTAILPRSLRERLKREMGAEVGASDASSSAMAGVLGVSSLGLALRAGTPGSSANVLAELVCDGEEECVAVEKLIARKRLDWSKDLSLRLVGFGPLLDAVEIQREGPRVRVTTGGNAAAVAATIDRVLRFSAHRESAAPAIPAAPSSPPASPSSSAPAPPSSR